jgi:hypothetical protein
MSNTISLWKNGSEYFWKLKGGASGGASVV